MFQITNFRFPETIVRGETPRFTIKCETCFSPGFFGANFLFTSEQQTLVYWGVFLSQFHPELLQLLVYIWSLFDGTDVMIT